MIFVHSSTVAAILCQLPDTSNPQTVGGMCYTIIGLTAIGLTSHCSVNYKITTNHGQAYNRHP